jgi:RNA polymerase sigma factor (TIGR02999 family)
MWANQAGDITRALAAAYRDEPGAHEQLWSVVYGQLRELAGRLRLPQRDLLHQTTDVVHEVFDAMRRQRAALTSRERFFGFAALAMRRVVVNWARKAIREGQHCGGSSSEPRAEHELTAEELVQLDEALSGLASLNPRCARVVELRYFCGLDSASIAAQLGVSARTVEADWTLARAWLRARLYPAE